MAESNRIEGIHQVRDYDRTAHQRLWALEIVHVSDLEAFVKDVAARPLRTSVGMDVRVGNHYPPSGGPHIRSDLEELLTPIVAGAWTPYAGHVAYEKLHPFLDGNGRSGRALWAWHMLQDGLDPFGLGFLHRFYYQALDASRA